MGNEVDNKFSWVIKNFKSLQSTKVYSDHFSIGGCKWQLIAFPKRYVGNLSLYLKVYKHGSLPRGWKRQASFSFTVVNQIYKKLSQRRKTETPKWFDENNISCGFSRMLHLSKLNEDDSGFLLNGELKLLVQVDILQVIGESSEAVDQEIVASVLLLPSQVESVNHIFESHPDIVSEVRTKSQHLRTTYIVVLLGLIKTLCQSPEELTDDDLKEASAALSYLVNAGFKVDWLDKKLHQVLEKKKIVKTNVAILLEVKEELLKLNKKTQDLNDLLEKKTLEVAAAITPLSFDDFL